MPDAIRIEGVRKAFGSKVAVDHLDLVVPEGRLYGLIGPNGAGKTTSIRMVMSILFPDSGSISVLGRRSALESKDQIGYLPEERGLYRKMRVGAFLKHIGRLKGLSGAGLSAKVMGWLERVGLADCYRKRCEELSKGMQQKVQVIAALLHEPRLIILDEPFSGLDPVNMRLLRDLILEQHRAGRTVIFSTHVMQQAEQMCEHIVMIHNGRKVLDDSLADIRARHDPRSIIFEPVEDAGPEGVQGMRGVRTVTRTDRGYEVSLDEGTTPADAMRRIVEAVPVSRVELRRPTLEDVFIEIAQARGGDEQTEEQMRAALRDDPARATAGARA